MAVPNKYGFKNNKDLQDMDLAIEAKFNSLMDKMFPIGSIVITTDNKNPAEKGYPGNKSDWRLICDGMTIVGRSADGPAPFDTKGGNEGTGHTHTIYATEIIDSELPNPEWLDDRQIYADVLDGNSDQCNQSESSGPCYRYLLHTITGLSGGDLNGRLQLVKTFKNYVWNDPNHNPPEQIGYANPIKAGIAGSDGELFNNLPPYMVMNIWRRYT